MTTAGDCKNCGAPLSGAYCSTCGQKADVGIPSVGALLADAIGDLFNFDSRIWRSLSTLTLKPGRLTRSYLEGQRARYTPPFRMYVVTSLTFFLAFSLVRSAGPSVDSAAAEIDSASDDAPAAERVEQSAAAAEGPFNLDIDGDEVTCGVDQSLPLGLRQRLDAACEQLRDDGTSFWRALADNVPVMMLVFIPLVAGIMRLLYAFARRKYVEHLLFFLHLHTFFFVTAIVTLLLSLPMSLAPLEWPLRIVSVAVLLYFPVYLYLAMRHVYAQSRWLTALKYVMLGASYMFAFMLTMLVTIVVTAVTI